MLSVGSFGFRRHRRITTGRLIPRPSSRSSAWLGFRTNRGAVELRSWPVIDSTPSRGRWQTPSARHGKGRAPWLSCGLTCVILYERNPMNDSVHKIVAQNETKLRTPYYLIDETRLLKNLNKIKYVREKSGVRAVLA